jgi:hypothetical protein
MGTLKGWKLDAEAPNYEKCREALERYHAEPISWSAMTQRDSDDQKKALCDLIDLIDGPVQSDWSGESFTKEEAKIYIREYNRPD